LPPVEPLVVNIDATHKIERIGKVSHYIGTSLVIRSEYPSTLDIDSVLCLENRKYVGKVEDVIGPVAKPFYIVRFNTEEEAKSFEKGSDVYYVADLSHIVNIPDIITKGSDASASYDEEPAADVFVSTCYQITFTGSRFL
jgi:H/ACA ribonucleoprotein complex non-core subunit NAF1